MMLHPARYLPIFYFLVSLPVSMLFSAITPPFQVPDEVQHYLYARAITTGSVVPEDLEGGGVGGNVALADAHLISAFEGIAFDPTAKVTSNMLAVARGASDLTLHPQNYWGAALYPPTAYAVPAAALVAADLAGLSRLSAFHVGRAANAIFLAILGALAIWLTPLGRLSLTCLLLLPMTLSQAGSYSADAFVIGATALICAIIARCCSGRQEHQKLLLTVAGLLILAMAPVKSPMIALVIPFAIAAWPTSRRLTISLVIIIIAFFLFWTIVFVFSESQSARVSFGNVSSANQIEFILSNPLSITEIASETLKTFYLFYFYGIIGIFGWLDTYLSIWFYQMAFLVLICALIFSAVDEHGIPAQLRAAFIGSSLLATALTFGALYLTWTDVGASVVQGVQGRYFIPIMIPAALGVAAIFRRPTNQYVSSAVVAGLFAFHVVSLMHVSRVLVTRFYLS